MENHTKSNTKASHSINIKAFKILDSELKSTL
jgi:hypothetical protein